MPATVRETKRILRDGVFCSGRVWGLVEAARESVGLPESRCRVVQGSWHAGSLSGGTHTGGGAVDLAAAKLSEVEALALLGALRALCGGPAWLRSPKYGWPERLSGPHIHVVVRDEPGLSKAAADQVRAYDRGLNGLANRGRDLFARPAWTPFRLWGTPAPWPGHRLQLGSSGPAVRDLQRALEIVADGQFGPQTRARVKRHQLSRPGLWPADGVCGPATYMSAINWGWR